MRWKQLIKFKNICIFFFLTIIWQIIFSFIIEKATGHYIVKFVPYVIWVAKVAQPIMCRYIVPPSRLHWQSVTTTPVSTKYIHCIYILVIIKINIFQRLIHFYKFYNKAPLMTCLFLYTIFVRIDLLIFVQHLIISTL